MLAEAINPNGQIMVLHFHVVRKATLGNGFDMYCGYYSLSRNDIVFGTEDGGDVVRPEETAVAQVRPRDSAFIRDSESVDLPRGGGGFALALSALLKP